MFLCQMRTTKKQITLCIRTYASASKVSPISWDRMYLIRSKRQWGDRFDYHFQPWVDTSLIAIFTYCRANQECQ